MRLQEVRAGHLRAPGPQHLTLNALSRGRLLP
jgi:hypothetical protein